MSKDVLGICHSWSDDRFTVSEVGGAAAAEKEQKKQEHEVDTTQHNCWEPLRNALLSVILLGRLRRSKKHWATWRIRPKEQSLTDGVTNGVYRSALHVFPWQKWKESSEKTWSFRIVSVRFSAERKNWLGRLYTKTLNTVDLFRWKDTLRLAHFCLGWGRAEWEELFRCSAELEVWPWRSFETEAVVFEHVPKVRWTRHFCLALIAKTFLHMPNQSSHEFSDASKQRQRDTGTIWNNCFVCLVPVSGNTEAEGNGRFHQRPQYDRDRFLRRWSKAQVFATEVGSKMMEIPGHSPWGWRSGDCGWFLHQKCAGKCWKL